MVQVRRWVFISLLLTTTLKADSRGIALLPLPHPKFPVKESCSLLRSSPKPSFSFLADTTFGTSYENVETLLTCLHKVHPALLRSEYRLPVRVYLLCGPCRRPRRNGSIPHTLPDLTIPSLNKALSTQSPKTTRSVRRRVELLAALIYKWPEVDFVVVPELEDNLTRRAFDRLVKIIKNNIPDVVIERNALIPVRYNGKTEIHSYSQERLQQLRSGDTMSGDGVSTWPSLALVREADRRRIHFHFWQPSLQGITRNPNLHPRLRVYRFENPSRIEALLKG